MTATAPSPSPAPTPTLDQLVAAADLPSLPEVVAYIIHALHDDNADLETLARHVNSDPAIVARVLTAANAVSLGLSKHMHSIGQAFMLLGIDRIVNLILASSLIYRYNECSSGFSAPLFWRHSLGVAVCSRALAEQTGTAHSELAFIGGLLHDIGRLLMYTSSPVHYLEALDCRKRDDIRLIVAEREVFGYDHCDAGQALASNWKLPPDIVEAIAAHHDPDEFGNEICDLVHIGECLSHALDLGEIAINRVPDLSELACANIGLSWPKFASRFAEIEARFDDFRLIMGL
ncbi:MAG: HDOD domain-containing protein [Candidatus Accumulibacter sp.]|jgi:putative nucleotidyltransferase with HDIG domain|nr:HDOD domain-containing protein [Accumulibacter sp.]